jgi:hypothetical protein
MYFAGTAPKTSIISPGGAFHVAPTDRGGRFPAVALVVASTAVAKRAGVAGVTTFEPEELVFREGETDNQMQDKASSAAVKKKNRLDLIAFLSRTVYAEKRRFRRLFSS